MEWLRAAARGFEGGGWPLALPRAGRMARSARLTAGRRAAHPLRAKRGEPPPLGEARDPDRGGAACGADQLEGGPGDQRSVRSYWVQDSVRDFGNSWKTPRSELIKTSRTSDPVFRLLTPPFLVENPRPIPALVAEQSEANVPLLPADVVPIERLVPFPVADSVNAEHTRDFRVGLFLNPCEGVRINGASFSLGCLSRWPSSPWLH
jgi:hypothetical protein